MISQPRKGGWHEQTLAISLDSSHWRGWVRRPPCWHERCPLRRPCTATNATASIPDFTGMWNHPAFPWFEPPASGPGPVTNKVRWPRVFGSSPAGTLALPPLKDGDGISDYDQLVGDYTQSDLAALGGGSRKEVRRNVARGHYLWKSVEPVLARTAAVHLQASPCSDSPAAGHHHDGVQREHGRAPRAHDQPHKDTPALYGDSVGHYEGDTLVIDTIGVRTDRKYADVSTCSARHIQRLCIWSNAIGLRDYDDVKGRNRAKQKGELAVCRRCFQRPSRQVLATELGRSRIRVYHDAVDLDAYLRTGAQHVARGCLC